MQITIEVPDRLGEKLQQLGDRLPEALVRIASEVADRALQELTSIAITSTSVDEALRSLLQVAQRQQSNKPMGSE
jgi:predicted transcriptional regulator